MIIKRNISDQFQHFRDKLLFISGPRQAGKTFIIKHDLKPSLILNMDVAKERLIFKKFPESIIDWYKASVGAFPSNDSFGKKPLIFIDEIQKVYGWRNIIKGTFDKTNHAINYVASGSSAFKLRKQDKGDSLAGRATWLTLFPISFREYIATIAPDVKLSKIWKGDFLLSSAVKEILKYSDQLRSIWDDYITFGSFPENLVRKDPIFYKQWLEDYLSALLDKDLKDLYFAKDTECVYQVFQLLLEGLGSTFSLRSIAETLSTSPNTSKSDIRTLEQVMWGFALPVANVSKVKQIRKEKKFYPMDFSLTNYQRPLMEGGQFECVVASLLRRGLFSEISSIVNPLHLGYYRDYDKREVDFVIQTKKEIILSAECKLKEKLGTGHLKFMLKYNPRESVLIVEEPGIFKCVNGIYIISIEFLAACLA